MTKLSSAKLKSYGKNCYSLPQTWVFLYIQVSDAVLTLKPTTTIFEVLRALLLKIQVFWSNTPYKLLNNISNRI
jgi:hypothetical protein